MHLWPSQRIRDSFKESHVSKMEWNLNRMKQSRGSSSSSAAAAAAAPDQNLKLPLLSSSESRKGNKDPNNKAKAAAAAAENTDLLPWTKITALLDLSQDLVLILTCCVCSLCFGVTTSRDEEEQ